jgi:hypothetical protein
MRYLITLRLTPADSSLDHAQHLLKPFGLRVDAQYGLVLISPKRSLYVVRVEGDIEEAALSALPEVVGVHGDPKIAPIGKDHEDNKGE